MQKIIKTFNRARQQVITARKIKKTNCEIRSLKYTSFCDGLVVQGIVHKQVFFVGSDNKIHHISGDIPFSAILNIPGARPEMDVSINADLERIHTVLTPSGKCIFFEAIIKISATVENTIYVFVVEGVDRTIIAKTPIVENDNQALLDNTLVLKNPVRKISESNSKIIINSTELLNDKVLIQATFHNQVFYIGEDNLSYHEAFDIPVSCFVDVIGALPSMKVCIKPTVETSKINIIPPNALKLTAIIQFKAVVVDESIIGIAIAPEGQEYNVATLVGQSSIFQHLVESTQILQHKSVKIRNIETKLYNVSSSTIADKVIINGVLHKQIYYVGIDNINYHQSENIPFTTFVDYPGAEPNQDTIIKSVVECTKYQLNGNNGLFQQNIIKFDVTVVKQETLPVVLGIDSDTRICIPQIIGGDTTQIMINDIEQIEIIDSIVVTKEPIVTSVELTGSRQTQVSDSISICPPATSIVHEQCVLENINTLVQKDGVIISGYVKCNIIYIDETGRVHNTVCSCPFTVMIPLEGILPTNVIEVNAFIEHVNLTISPNGNHIKIFVVIKVDIKGLRKDIVYVVTDVTGPHITTKKVLVLAELPSMELKQMFVVTEVYGENICIIKKPLKLNVVGEGPRLIDVVVDVMCKTSD